MGQMLIEIGVISKEQLTAALVEQEQSGEKLGTVLIKQGALSEQQLMESLELMLGIPWVHISKMQIDPEIIKILPPHLISQHKVLPLKKHNNSLTVAMADPLNQQSIDDLSMASGMDIIPVIASERELDLAIGQYLAFRPDPVMERMLGELSQDDKSNYTTKKFKDLINTDDEAPVIQMVNAMLKQAVRGRASDIHIEPQDEQTRVRFRIDGELYQVLSFPQSSLAVIISRLKIMAGMDIAEKRVPQDGRFRLEIEGREVDFRVSSLPTSNGEKIALRILDRTNTFTNIEQLGLTINNQEKILTLAHRPYGLVLVTGPTGSGKTTTLYTILNEINSVDKNIITLEDPIEYSIAGINQVQTNIKAGLTFASGLRSILRQDPDIIMLGEIRDLETARLAVQAALTGHLVFSTLHTNSAVGTIARLRDIGIEGYLLASALAGVISQRLVRRLCPNCIQAYRLDEATAVKLGLPEESNQEFYYSVGCHMCRQSGYQGRLALHEIMVLDKQSRQLISRGEFCEENLEMVALYEGMRTMKTDGIEKARKGLTSLEEVMKAVLLES